MTLILKTIPTANNLLQQKTLPSSASKNNPAIKSIYVMEPTERENCNRNAAHSSAVHFASAMLVVRARIIEAVYVMAHISVAHSFPAKTHSAWPQYVQDTINENDVAYAKNAANKRFSPDAAAHSPP